jgi:hypothetical protein
VTIRQVGIERLTLPTETLNATVARMRAERETVAAERQAEGQRAAAEIASNADRDARVLRAKAKAEAASIDAKSRLEAADIYGQAYNSAPDLYMLLRSLDTLDTVVGANTRLILRTDAAPFRVLVDGPANASAAAAPAAPPVPVPAPPEGCSGAASLACPEPWVPAEMTTPQTSPQTMPDVREGAEPSGAWAQSAKLAFRFLFLVVCLAAIGWSVSNFRQVPPESRALVFRFGQLVRQQGSGLLMAWPQPIERLVVLPSGTPQLEFRIEQFEPRPALGGDFRRSAITRGRTQPSC